MSAGPQRLSTEWRLPPARPEPWLRSGLRQLARDRLFQVLVIAQTLALSPYLGLLAGRPPSFRFRDGFAFVLLGGVTGVALAVGGWRSRLAAERRMHLGVALACLLWALEELLESVVWNGGAGWVAVGLDALFVGFYAAMILATDDALGAGPESRGLQRLEHLELAVFLIGLLLYFAVVPGRFDPEAYLTAIPSTALFLGLDLLIAAWFVRGWRRAGGPKAKFRWAALVVAAGFFVLDDGLYLLSLTSGLDLTAVALDFLWFVPFPILGAALRVGAAETRARRSESDPLQLPTRRLGTNLGWLFAALLPAGHLAVEVFGGWMPASAAPRRWTVLAAALVLGGLAVEHQRRLAHARRAMVEEIETLRQREAIGSRLEAIGSLAGGVALDFQQIVEQLRTRIGELAAIDLDDRSQLDLEAMRRAAERAARLTRDLLAVGQRERPQRRRIELRSWLEGLVAQLREGSQENVRIVCDTGSEPLPCDVDPEQLERVVGNLVLNAREALVEGGTVELALRRRRGGEHAEARPPRDSAPDQVMLVVRDDGPGIDAETRQRIFEPFFTTKRDAVGHGLGLSTALGLVRAHGGELRLASEPGEGAAFEIVLPLAV